jgi:predicted transcriptional regulator
MGFVASRLVPALSIRVERQCGGGMARFGELEAAIMDVMWAAGGPLRVRVVADELNRARPLAFNTVQTVMENLFRKGWLNRRKDGRAYFYVTVRSQEDYVAGLLSEALAVARDPAATLVRLVEDLEPAEIAQLRVALDAAADRDSSR